MLIDLDIIKQEKSSNASLLEEVAVPSVNTNIIVEQGYSVPFEESYSYYISGTNRKEKNLFSTKINSEERDLLISVKKLESELFSLQACHEYRKAMSRIYEQFLFWKNNHMFTECDKLMDNINVSMYDMRILVTILMASAQIKPRLSYRSVFFDKVLERAQSELQESEIDLIFSGLR